MFRVNSMARPEVYSIITDQLKKVFQTNCHLFCSALGVASFGYFIVLVCGCIADSGMGGASRGLGAAYHLESTLDLEQASNSSASNLNFVALQNQKKKYRFL